MAEKGSLAGNLHGLLESGEGADVTLVVGESELPAHSFILAARSPVFAAMLRNDMREASSHRIQISDVQEAALRQMLCFVYTDTVPQLASVAAELLAAADKYDLPLLKKRCEQQMERDIRVDNAAATAALAVLHRCPGLKSAALEFIAAHPEVLATEGWERMMRDTVVAAVEVCRQLAATPRPQSAPPETVTKATATDPQAAEKPNSSIVSKEGKQMMKIQLIKAAWSGCAREVWVLLAAGADKDARDNNGNTALHLAAVKGHTSTVKCLIAGGLDVNAVNDSGQAPLHKATCKGDTDIIWMLVAAAARVDVQDNQGRTPLHVAAQKEYKSSSGYSVGYPTNYYSHGQDGNSNSNFDPTRVVKVLLLAGAKKDVKDFSGKTPENVATPIMKSALNTYNDL